jgi:hypothetical protein
MRICIQRNVQQNNETINDLLMLFFDAPCTGVNANDAILFPVIGEVRLFPPRLILPHVLFVNSASGT